MPEYPVDPTGVEAQLEQPLLQYGHVVPDVALTGQGQQPVAEGQAGRLQRRVGLASDDSVDRHTPLLLERPYGQIGGLVEDRRAGQ